MVTKIVDVKVRDIRFPTSKTMDGSDAMNGNSDYSATYVTLMTDNPSGAEGTLTTSCERCFARSSRRDAAVSIASVNSNCFA